MVRPARSLLSLDSLVVQLPMLGFLVVAAALFAGCETALFSLTRTQRRRLERDSDPDARAVARLLQDPRGLLAGLLLGSILAQVFLAALVSDAAFDWLGLWPGAALSLAFSSFLLLLPGSVIPRVVAAASPVAFARVCSRPVELLLRGLRPAAMPLEAMTGGAADRLVPPREGSVAPNLAGAEASGGAAGTAPPDGEEILEYMAEFQDTTARQVMTPRVEIVAADLEWTAERLRTFVRRARVSRVPLFRGNLDNVEAILRVKSYLLSGKPSPEPFVDRPYFIPEGKKLQALLRDFQDRHLHLAIVLDEHGQTTGLVTLEDILEELLGEVYDEGETQEELIEALPDGSWRIHGRALLEDVERETGLVLQADEGIDTLGGLVMNFLGEIPRRGESFLLCNHDFRITKASRRRVKEVVVRRLQPPARPAAGEEAEKLAEGEGD